MPSVLTIAGSPVNRQTARLILNRWTVSLDRPDELEFTQLAASLPGAYAPEQTVTLTVGGTVVFSGWIFSRSPANAGTGSISVGYRCLGLKYAAYLMPVTASDGTGTMTFNLPTTDQNYTVTEAGLSVGQILTQVFNQHSSQLAAIGITGFNSGDLAALTAVPPETVYFSGNSFWSQVDQLLQTWYGSRYASYVTPATGQIRVFDTTSLSAQTLTLGTDPITLDSLREDTSECYTQVILRGRDNVQPAYLSLLTGTLTQGWTSGQQAAWNINTGYYYPTGAYDTGTITAQSSSTITVQSSSPTETWPVNYWSGIGAQVAVINPIATDITGFEYKQVTACTALTAGGTSVLTLDSPLVNSGYSQYQIRGLNSAASNVWRVYTIPNFWVAQHLVQQFNYSVPWSPSQGALTETNYPIGVVCYSTGGLPLQVTMNFEVVPYNGSTNGYIRFYNPVPMLYTSAAALAQGGSAVSGPTDIQVLLPYSRGTLYAQYPSSGYGGTAYTEFGVQRTLYRDYPTFNNAGNLTLMDTLAQQVHATVSNTIQEGSVTYYGQYSAALTPGSPIALNLANIFGTTSYESMAAPVRTATLEWPQQGAAEWVTRLQFSTRRQQFSGDRLYVHPNYAAGTGSAWSALAVSSASLPSAVSSGWSADYAGQTAASQTGAAGAAAGSSAGLSAGLAGSQVGQVGAGLMGGADQAAGGILAGPGGGYGD
jgi:hypothetical protein